MFDLVPPEECNWERGFGGSKGENELCINVKETYQGSHETLEMKFHDFP